MLVTSIGSLPFVDVDRAIDLIFKSCPEIPFWPQMPNRSFLEGMYVQCLERVPAVRVDEVLGKVYVDTNATEEIEVFYEDFSNGRFDSFAISEERAPGFYRLLERLPEIEDTTKYIKTQLTGPFTMGMGLKDELGRPIIYNAAYFDIIKKALHGKAEWMIRTIKARASGKEVILFFDEPAMVSFGSAFVSVSRRMSSRCLTRWSRDSTRAWGSMSAETPIGRRSSPRKPISSITTPSISWIPFSISSLTFRLFLKGEE